MSWTTQYVLFMSPLEQPNFSTRLTEFLLELKDRHQICYNLCKTAVLECNLGCLVKPPGKTIKGYKPRARCFSRTFVLWPKLVEAPSVLTTKNTIFVCLFAVCCPPAPSLTFSWPVTLQYDSGFEAYAPHTMQNDLIFFQEFCIS